MEILPSLTPAQFAERAIAAPIIMMINGVLLVQLSRWAGDAGAGRSAGQAAGSLRFVDLVGLFAAVFFRACWSRAVDIDTTRFRHGITSRLLVVAGTAGGLLSVAVAALFMRPLAFTLLADEAAIPLSNFLGTTYEIGVRSALFAVLPVPPLAGAVLLPASLRRHLNVGWMRSYRWIVPTLLVVVLALGVLDAPFRSVSQWLASRFGW